MRIGNYEVQITGGQDQGNGYIHMQHGQTYKLRLSNTGYKRCDAEVKIDGRSIGAWRLNPHQSVTVDGPTDANLRVIGEFTFYRLGTTSAAIAQVADSNDTGLVQVVFTPEKEPEIKPVSRGIGGGNPYYKGMPDSLGFGGDSGLESMPTTRGYHAGGTGLSGQSNQRFGQAEYIPLDHANQVTISLRLVEYVPVNYPRPLMANAVPPRIG